MKTSLIYKFFCLLLLQCATFCGADQNQPIKEKDEKTEVKKNNRLRNTICAIASVVVVVSGFFIFKRRNRNGLEEDTPPTHHNHSEPGVPAPKSGTPDFAPTQQGPILDHISSADPRTAASIGKPMEKPRSKVQMAKDDIQINTANISQQKRSLESAETSQRHFESSLRSWNEKTSQWSCFGDLKIAQQTAESTIEGARDCAEKARIIAFQHIQLAKAYVARYEAENEGKELDAASRKVIDVVKNANSSISAANAKLEQISSEISQIPVPTEEISKTGLTVGIVGLLLSGPADRSGANKNKYDLFTRTKSKAYDAIECNKNIKRQLQNIVKVPEQVDKIIDVQPVIDSAKATKEGLTIYNTFKQTFTIERKKTKLMAFIEKALEKMKKTEGLITPDNIKRAIPKVIESAQIAIGINSRKRFKRNIEACERAIVELIETSTNQEAFKGEILETAKKMHGGRPHDYQIFVLSEVRKKTHELYTMPPETREPDLAPAPLTGGTATLADPAFSSGMGIEALNKATIEAAEKTLIISRDLLGEIVKSCDREIAVQTEIYKQELNGCRYDNIAWLLVHAMSGEKELFENIIQKITQTKDSEQFYKRLFEELDKIEDCPSIATIKYMINKGRSKHAGEGQKSRLSARPQERTPVANEGLNREQRLARAIFGPQR